jgi:hypothetical protein
MKDIFDVIKEVFLWLVNRSKNKLAYISQQLKDNKEISHQMRESLQKEVEALLLKITKGISVPYHMISKLMAISEDNIGGVEWRTIKHSLNYIKVDENGNLKVVITRADVVGAWVFAAAAILFFSMFILFAIGGRLSTNPKVMISYFILSLVCMIPTMIFLTPMRNINAARKIDGFLKNRRVQ